MKNVFQPTVVTVFGLLSLSAQDDVKTVGFVKGNFHTQGALGFDSQKTGGFLIEITSF